MDPLEIKDQTYLLDIHTKIQSNDRHTSNIMHIFT